MEQERTTEKNTIHFKIFCIIVIIIIVITMVAFIHDIVVGINLEYTEKETELEIIKWHLFPEDKNLKIIATYIENGENKTNKFSSSQNYDRFFYTYKFGEKNSLIKKGEVYQGKNKMWVLSPVKLSKYELTINLAELKDNLDPT